MIRGMSYPKGVFYMDKDHIAHAAITKDGEIHTSLFSFDSDGILFFIKRTIFSIPWYFALGMLLLAIWVGKQPGVPFFYLLLAGFGYHFIFPYPLKQFHGAEHKVFSHQGNKSIQSLEDIKKCDIVNRHCSTNAVTTFYLLFLMGFFPLGGNGAALVGLLGVWLVPRWFKKVDQHVVFPISSFFQKRVTTVEPEEKHLKAALFSYISLKRRKAINELLLLEEIRIEEENVRRKRLLEEREQVIRETEYREI